MRRSSVLLGLSFSLDPAIQADRAITQYVATSQEIP